MGQLKKTWHKASLGVWDPSFYKKDHALNSQKADKVFFSLLMNVMLYGAIMIYANVFIDWNCFSGERRGPWLSRFFIVYSICSIVFKENESARTFKFSKKGGRLQKPEVLSKGRNNV